MAVMLFFKLILNMTELHFIYRDGNKPYVLEPFLVTHPSYLVFLGLCLNKLNIMQ